MGLIKFARRHKKKLIFLFVFFGGGYLSVKYAIRQIKQSLFLSTKSLSAASQQYATLRKYEHYLTIKQTSDEAVIELSKTMHNKIREILPTEDLLAQLKQRPPNKLEIWEKLKIMCVSRCFATIYSLSFLCLFIKVELNVIGGYLFVGNSVDDSLFSIDSLFDPKPNKTSIQPAQKLSPSTQQKYLENIENFIKKELVHLIEDIEESCQLVFSEVNLKENMTIDMLQERFEQVHKRLRHKLKRTTVDLNDIDREFYEFQEKNSVSDYLLPDIQTDMDISVVTSPARLENDKILNDLNLETLDILTSKDFQITIDSLIESLSNEFMSLLTSIVFQEIIQVEKETSEIIEISVPFAKLIPIFDQAQQVFQTNNSSLFKVLENFKLNVFSANIYESFSYTPSAEQQKHLNKVAAIQLPKKMSAIENVAKTSSETSQKSQETEAESAKDAFFSGTMFD